MVRRPSESKVLSMGNVSSRKSSKRRRKDETESSNRPRPSWSFEQSRRTMGGRWLYCKWNIKGVNERPSNRWFVNPLTLSSKSRIWFMSRGKPSMMIPFLFNSCSTLLWISLSRLSFVTISPVVIASLMAKFSVKGFGSDSASDRKLLPMLEQKFGRLRFEPNKNWANKTKNLASNLNPARLSLKFFSSHTIKLNPKLTLCDSNPGSSQPLSNTTSPYYFPARQSRKSLSVFSTPSPAVRWSFQLRWRSCPRARSFSCALSPAIRWRLAAL